MVIVRQVIMLITKTEKRMSPTTRYKILVFIWHTVLLRSAQMTLEDHEPLHGKMIMIIIHIIKIVIIKSRIIQAIIIVIIY